MIEVVTGDKIVQVVVYFTVETEELDDEQKARLVHHLKAGTGPIAESSGQSMLKGVKKYGPEPYWDKPIVHGNQGMAPRVLGHWLPHIFSEMVDGANQVALMAETLGVEL